MTSNFRFSSFCILRFSFIALLASLTGCVSFENATSRSEINQNVGYLEEFPSVGIDQIRANSLKDVFRNGDTAEVYVYNVEELSNRYVVDRAGNINFPLIGNVQVSGISTTELQEELTRRYGEQYLRNPNINVTLQAIGIGSVVVDGSVNSPGVFDMKKIIRLTEAIALAEGLATETTNGSQVFLIRNIDGARKVTEIDLREVRKLNAPDPQIIPDDVIFVQDSGGRILFKEFLRTVPLLNTAAILTVRR